MKLYNRVLFRLRFLIWAKIRANFYPSFYFSHSQFGEDMVVRYLTGDTKRGFYVDIGAHHPVYFSNTYHFYCKGWKGINIDAVPNSMKLFHVLRPGDINLEVCVSPVKDTETEFFIFEQSAYNTFDVDMADKALSLGVSLLEKQILLTTTLKEILDSHLPAGAEIDLMSIDIEGIDEAVLMSNDWELYKPKIIIFEKHDLSIQKLTSLPIVKFLDNYGYKIEAKCGPSVVLKLE